MKEIDVALPVSVNEKFIRMCSAIGMTSDEGVRFIVENGVASFLSKFDRFYQTGDLNCM